MSLAKRRSVARASADDPKEIPPLIVAAILEVIDEGGTNALAAESAGIHKTTLSEWLHKEGEPYESFAREFRKRKARAGLPLVRAACIKDPVTMVSRIYGVSDRKPKEKAPATIDARTSLTILVQANKALPRETLQNFLRNEDAIDVETED